ncbi:phosphoesterase [Ferroglobus placidus DSM 10642]|uniref:Phosphoesterase n=1 Tax=Ferroglobus placidus (strain DSM 10642 / AEDII12DO) TaxID=589924 RepID=D3RYG8_FERPA|nr:metallophosphoesterase [Ferroglobus placidus]ADC65531.1 phosphoesterase [Ferroglobus placidus DSM 10642]
MKLKDFKLTPERAAIAGNVAIIADLHLGIENAMVEKGVSIPELQFEEVMGRTLTIIERYGVKKLVIAGDLKHEFGRNLPLEWKDVSEFLEELSDKVDLEVVRGNHDNFLPAILAKYGLELKEEVRIKGWKVVHGHKEVEGDRIIMGHEHPAVKIRYGGAVYSYPCFLHARNDREILVLPAQSSLSSGTDVLTADKFLSPMLSFDMKIDVYAVEDEVYYLGELGRLKTVV